MSRHTSQSIMVIEFSASVLSPSISPGVIMSQQSSTTTPQEANEISSIARSPY